MEKARNSRNRYSETAVAPNSEEENLMAETTKKTTTRKKTSASVSAPTSIASKKTSAKASVTVTHEEIARLAHKFWAERGGQHGHDAEDWFRAEQTLLGKAS